MSFLNKLTYHNVKKAVSSTVSAPEHPTEAGDPAFEAAYAAFLRFHTAAQSLDNSLSQYSKHFFELFSSSSDIIHSMSNAITNDDDTALRNTFASTRDSHAALTGEREQALSAELRERCLHPVSEELQVHAKLLTLVQQRHDLAKELDYYNGKLQSILKDKAAAEAKGKTFDHDKVERNQKKHSDAVAVFDTVNADCIGQLQAADARKGEVLMQVFAAFEQVERKVAETYLAAVSAPITVMPTSSGRRGSGIVNNTVEYPTAGGPGELQSGSAPTVSLGLEGSNGMPATLMASPPPYQPSAFPVRSASPLPRPPGSPQPAPPKDPPPPPTKRI